MLEPDRQMTHRPVAFPESDETQIPELHRLLQLGTPTLVVADGERLDMPVAVFRLLKDIVRNMQLGRAVVLVPENQQLTTQRAADMLGVSRPHLIKLLEAGDLAHHKAGSHRRIAFTIALEFPIPAMTNESLPSRRARRVCPHPYAVGRYAASNGRSTKALCSDVVAEDHG